MYDKSYDQIFGLTKLTLMLLASFFLMTCMPVAYEQIMYEYDYFDRVMNMRLGLIKR